MVGFVFFPPCPRNVSPARALGARGTGRGRAEMWRCRSTGRCRPRADRRGAAPRHAAAARQGDAGARRGRAQALRPAGDEGAAGRDGGRSCRRAAYATSPTGCCSTPARRATRRGPAASASRSTGTLLEGLDPGLPFMLSGGLDAGNVAEALRITARARRRCLVRRRDARRARRIPDKIRAFMRAARAAARRHAQKVASIA